MNQWLGDEREGTEPLESSPEHSETDGAAEEQLTLTDEDEHLPWLESDDEEVEDKFDTRLIALALIGLLLVIALVGAIWWLTRDRAESDIEPDGSVIEAPEEPYRSRPENPGGEEVAGTGELSYEVGEGESREGRIADSTPAPSIDRDQGQVADEGDDEETSAPAASGVGVQVGAFSSPAAAEAAWSQFANRYSALSGVSHRVIEGQADSGTIFRLQAVAGNRDSADAMCRSIRSEGGDCQVKR